MIFALFSIWISLWSDYRVNKPLPLIILPPYFQEILDAFFSHYKTMRILFLIALSPAISTNRQAQYYLFPNTGLQQWCDLLNWWRGREGTSWPKRSLSPLISIGKKKTTQKVHWPHLQCSLSNNGPFMRLLKKILRCILILLWKVCNKLSSFASSLELYMYGSICI